MQRQNTNIKKEGCSDPLVEIGNIFTAAGSTTTPNTFTTPTGRGQILGVEIYLGNNTIADLAAGSITMAVNGVNYLQANSLLRFGAIYENSRIAIMFEKPIAEGATITTTVICGTANAVIVGMNFLYYNVYHQ